jgi:predicted deacylase
MITLTERATGPITLRAPAGGRVLFHAPPALCGELEVFEAGDVVANVGDTEVCAPARGFVVRRLVAEGTPVVQAMPLVDFRTA